MRATSTVASGSGPFSNSTAFAGSPLDQRQAVGPPSRFGRLPVLAPGPGGEVEGVVEAAETGIPIGGGGE